jgi:trk system potassium uptake protein TrkH
MMMVMLLQDKQSMNLYNAEGHPDKLMPNLKKTAQTIFLIYNSFLAAGTAAYRLAGMRLFDALLHTMCALSTGGFSTKLNSIGEYNSMPIELITVILMLIGTTNFAVLLLVSRVNSSK